MNVEELFVYRSDEWEGEDGTDEIDLLRDRKRGLVIGCDSQGRNGYSSCRIPDPEALRLAIALIQATPPGPHLINDRYGVAHCDSGGIDLYDNERDTNQRLFCESPERAIELGLALIRAAQVKR